MVKNNIDFYQKGSVEILYGESNHCFPLHSHESFCIGMVIEGEVVFNINNSPRLLRRAMVFLIPSNTGVVITPVQRYSYVTVCFKDSLRERFSHFEISEYFFQLESEQVLLDLCDRFIEKEDEENFCRDISDLLIHKLKLSSIKKQGKKSHVVLETAGYINAHVGEKLDLEDLAIKMYVSKYHLIRIFKNEMGVTPYQYYIQAKIRLIKEEVFAKDNQTQLAMKFNFSEQSHLCNVFKKQMGISLRQYKMHLNKK